MTAISLKRLKLFPSFSMRFWTISLLPSIYEDSRIFCHCLRELKSFEGLRKWFRWRCSMQLWSFLLHAKVLRGCWGQHCFEVLAEVQLYRSTMPSVNYWCSGKQVQHYWAKIFWFDCAEEPSYSTKAHHYNFSSWKNCVLLLQDIPPIFVWRASWQVCCW